MAEATEDLAEWSKVITPERGLFDLKWKQLWQYRDLIALFVQRDFVTTYKQTILGPLWFLIQPFMTTVVFTVVLGKVAQVSTDRIPDFLFYMSGIVTWSYFAACVNKTATVFTTNSGLFGKVYFPRLTVPISIVISNLVTFGIQFLFFMGFYVYYLARGAPIEPSYRIIVLPVLIVEMAALGIGVGCLVSALTTRYRDLVLAVTFGVQLWMYASSVVVPLSEVPERWQWLFILNPMVPVIESFRFAFFGKGIVEIWQLGVSCIMSALIFGWGIVMFNRMEKTFTDTV